MSLHGSLAVKALTAIRLEPVGQICILPVEVRLCTELHDAFAKFSEKGPNPLYRTKHNWWGTPCPASISADILMIAVRRWWAAHS